MNINVQQQNFEKVDSLKVGKENIEDVKNKADDNISKLEKNPEQKKWIVNRIKEKLFSNQKDNKKLDDQPKTNEAEKQEQEDKTKIIDNQGWANLDKNAENTSQ